MDRISDCLGGWLNADGRLRQINHVTWTKSDIHHGGSSQIQNALQAQKIPVGLAFMIFCQNFAGAIFVVVGNVIFTQCLAMEIRAYAPSVSVGATLAAGASPGAVRALVSPGSPELKGVLLAFSNIIDKVFYLLITCCCAGFLAALG